MTLYSKKDIVQQARNLAKMISETEEVDFFKRAEAQINENEKVSAIINQIKTLQKQAVNLKHYEKLEALKQVESKIDALQEELEGIPIIQEFRELSSVHQAGNSDTGKFIVIRYEFYAIEPGSYHG